MANSAEQPSETSAQTVEYNPATESYEPVASAPVENTAARAAASPPSSPAGHNPSDSASNPPPAPPLPPSPEMPESTPNSPQQHQKDITARGSTPAAAEAVAQSSLTTAEDRALSPEETPAVKLLPTAPDTVSTAAAQQPASSRDWAKGAMAAIAAAEKVTEDAPKLDHLPPGPPVKVKEDAPLLPEVSRELADAAFVNVDSIPAGSRSPLGTSSAVPAGSVGAPAESDKSGAADELDDIISGRSAAPQPTAASDVDDAAEAAAADLDKANWQLANKLDGDIAATETVDAVAAELVADAIVQQAAEEALEDMAADASDAPDGDLVVVDVTQGPDADPIAGVLVPEDAPAGSSSKGAEGDTGATLIDATIAQATLEPEDSDQSSADVTVLDATVVEGPASDDDGDDVIITHVTAAVVEPEGAEADDIPSNVVIVEETAKIEVDAAEEAPVDEVAIVGSPTLKDDPAAAAAAGIVAVEVAAADEPSDAPGKDPLSSGTVKAMGGEGADDDDTTAAALAETMTAAVLAAPGASLMQGGEGVQDTRDGADKNGSVSNKPIDDEIAADDNATQGNLNAMGDPVGGQRKPQDGGSTKEEGFVAAAIVAIFQYIISLIKWLLSLVTAPKEKETPNGIPARRQVEPANR